MESFQWIIVDLIRHLRLWKCQQSGIIRVICNMRWRIQQCYKEKYCWNGNRNSWNYIKIISYNFFSEFRWKERKFIKYTKRFICIVYLVTTNIEGRKIMKNQQKLVISAHFFTNELPYYIIKRWFYSYYSYIV